MKPCSLLGSDQTSSSMYKKLQMFVFFNPAAHAQCVLYMLCNRYGTVCIMLPQYGFWLCTSATLSGQVYVYWCSLQTRHWLTLHQHFPFSLDCVLLSWLVADRTHLRLDFNVSWYWARVSVTFQNTTHRRQMLWISLVKPQEVINKKHFMN